MNNQVIHKPVLLKEVIEMFNINPSGVYVDCTAGFGGHSEAILNKLNNCGQLICIDQDSTSIEYLKTKFTNDQRIKIVHDNFINIIHILASFNIGKVDGILTDLGVSSLMFDNPNRGFSYHQDGKLDMRMNQKQKLDAFFVINNYDTKQLISIFKNYGEINNPLNVVNAIIKQRQIKPIYTTLELVDIIKRTIHKKELFKKKHPATKYFQAIRIEVNKELENLNKFLNVSTNLLKKHGILLVIAFHSLEDRLIKQYFSKLSSSKIPHEVPIRDEVIEFSLLNKKPVIASQIEISQNNRSRSAKLRGVMKN